MDVTEVTLPSSSIGEEHTCACDCTCRPGDPLEPTPPSPPPLPGFDLTYIKQVVDEGRGEGGMGWGARWEGGGGPGREGGREGGRELELLGWRYPVNLDEI